MKYVITGSTGNISKPLAQQLIKAGNNVTIISHQASRKADIEALGATAAIGSVEDVAFLTNTFKGADAIYTMVPPKWDAADWKGYIASIGNNYATAIKAAGVKYVVNLSSNGAHLPEGAGPVSGLYHVEKDLNALEGVNVKHLRAAFFYQNFLSNIALIKNMNIIGGNYGENSVLPLVHPNDIAAAAAELLLHLNFKGHSIDYVVGDEVSVKEVAHTLGAAIGKPELPWVNFKDEDVYGAMTGNGLSAEVAKNYVEMGSALRNGTMTEEYQKASHPFSKTKIADFAKEFAEVFSKS